MHEVTRAGHQRAEAVRGAQRFLRMCRRLHGVDIQMICARMPGVALQHGLERGDDCRTAAFGLRACSLPVVPWLRIHQRLGVEGLDGVVGGKARRYRLHRVCIRFVERRAIRLGIGRVALAERLDQRAIARRRGLREFNRLRQRGESGRVRVGHHRHVDVRPEDQRLAPEAECAAWIELLRLAKGALRLGMIEPEGEYQALIEPRLRLRIGGSRPEGERAEVLVKNRRLAQRGLRRDRLERCGFGLRENERAKHRRRTSGWRRADRSAVEQRIEPVATDAGCRRRGGKHACPCEHQRNAEDR